MTPSPNYFTAHLREIDESYGQHFGHASYYFVMLLAAAICALIHAILPFTFQKTSSQIIFKLHSKMTARKLIDAQSSPYG